MRLTVFLTERTYQQLVALTGAPVPQVIKRDAARLLSFAIRATFWHGLTVMNPDIQSHIGIVQIESPPDRSRTCEVCHASPVVPETGMCGPCTFGEADTADGNW
jgi:hypothetical protein